MKIPCIIHNLRSYDAYLILSAVKLQHGNISVIPNNTEKYTSFTIGDVTFIDSMQFMISPMEKLSKNLTDDNCYDDDDDDDNCYDKSNQIMEVRSNIIYLFILILFECRFSC